MLGLMQDCQLSISSIIEHAAANFPAKTVAAYGAGDAHTVHTYPQLADRCRRLASALSRLGFGQDDIVATIGWNSRQHLELCYGVPGIGAVLYTANPRSGIEDLRYTFGLAGCRAIFFDPECLDIVEQIASGGSIEHLVVIGDVSDLARNTVLQVVGYEDLLASGEQGFQWPRFDERTASGLCFTSGTTGRPKGVLYSHRAVVLAAMSVSHSQGWAVGPADTILALPSFFHSNGWCIPYFAPMVGADLVLPGRRMDGASLYRYIAEQDVTATGGVPTVFIDLLDHCRQNGLKLESLQKVFLGGSSWPPSLPRDLAGQHGVECLNAWGMTETTVASAIVRLDGGSPEHGRPSQGHPVFGVEMRIVDEAGDALERGGDKPGRLQARGPWLAAGYFRSEAPLLADEGWMQTGDIVGFSAANEMQLMDRDKDVIKSGGEWISSIAIELAAQKHPGIKSAAAIGVPHRKWIERPLLVVVPNGEEPLDESGLRDHLLKHLPRWWMPDTIRCLGDLPYSATGKVRKDVLRDRFKNEFELVEG